MKRVTKDEALEWKRMYEDRKLSIPAIAKIAKRNHHVVYYNLLRLGVVIRSGQVGEGVLSSEVDAWAQAFLQGRAPEEFLSEDENPRTSQTIYRHLAMRLKLQYLELIGKEVKKDDKTG